ncbi:S-layer protein [Bacillus thuringiensis]|uniref:S-layer homology domain-containing protein n=1 Tax=Bacillus thuringiensis TaxID=1428 RepID=UPI000BF332E0|nr:S-layer homology domain-containing protein [Bacillus thuringiensis]PER34065.1 S-layer protein [Bacillus thuringiensis]
MKLTKTFLVGATLATTIFTSLSNVQADTTFKDVPTNHWSYDAIMHLKEKNIVAGYGNGMFGLGDNITRRQAARLLYVYLQPLNLAIPYEDQFRDVKGTMFEKEIHAVVSSGLMNGYGDNMFGPDDVLTREQLAAILQNTFNLKAKSITTFNDVEKNYWATEGISALQENKIAVGTGDNLFEPKKVVTREQYAQFLYNAIRKLEKPGKPEVMPLGIPKSMVTDDFTFIKPWVDFVPVYVKSISEEAQSLINEMNAKYNLDIKYSEAGPSIDLDSAKMGSRALSLEEKNDKGPNFTIFFEHHKVSIQLTKRWVTMIYPDLNLDAEIDRLVKNPSNKFQFVKNQREILMGETNNKKGIYINIME